MTIRQRLATFMLAGALLGGGLVAVDAGTASAALSPSRSAAATSEPIAVAAAAALEALGTESYTGRLQNASAAVAAKLGADAGRLQQAWANADQAHQVALLSALTQVGVPYRRRTSEAGVGFDCSGLTTYAWAQSGINLYRQSAVQIRNASARTSETAQAGDLVYYPGHIMMWLGVDSLIVHSPYTGRNVEVTSSPSRRSGGLRFGNPVG
jgi:cell wall-associated NlpC family hydrolase